MKLEVNLHHQLVHRLHTYRRFGVGERSLDEALNELLTDALAAVKTRERFLYGQPEPFKREAEADTDYEGSFC